MSSPAERAIELRRVASEQRRSEAGLALLVAACSLTLIVPFTPWLGVIWVAGLAISVALALQNRAERRAGPPPDTGTQWRVAIAAEATVLRGLASHLPIGDRAVVLSAADELTAVAGSDADEATLASTHASAVHLVAAARSSSDMRLAAVSPAPAASAVDQAADLLSAREAAWREISQLSPNT